MKRSVSAMAGKEYDIVVVGGGIFGVCAAWDAALRGFSVALVEREDFSHAASAHHFRMIHGGIRYLQHGDIGRLRASSRERRAFLRVAPHLVHPLPIVVPTYGHGLKGKELLRLGLALYDSLTYDRNQGIPDADRRIPAGHVISRRETLALFPGLENPRLSGAAVFYDGQTYNPARLALSFLKSAARLGAEAANYVEATGFLIEGDRVVGIEARDRLAGGAFEIRGRMVINAAGPWAAPLLVRRPELRLDPSLVFSRDACFVVHRPIVRDYGLSLQGWTKDPDAILRRGNRHLFIVPWQNHTLVGVWHSVHRGSPDRFQVTEEEIQAFLDEINAAYPGLELAFEHVSRWMAGLVLFGERQKSGAHLSYGKRSQLIDHRKAHGIEGLITMIGVRFTTARGVAEKAVDLAVQKMGLAGPRSSTEFTPVYGGDIENFAILAHEAARSSQGAVRPGELQRLLHNYGSAYREVLALLAEQPRLAQPLGASPVTGAEVVHAVREEMVQKLGDVVFRRTDLGTAGHPGEAALAACARLVQEELGWDDARCHAELEAVRETLRGCGAREPRPQVSALFPAGAWMD